MGVHAHLLPYSMTWHPANLAWLPSLERAALCCSAGLQAGLRVTLFRCALPLPCQCCRSTSSMYVSFLGTPAMCDAYFIVVQHGLCSCTQARLVKAATRLVEIISCIVFVKSTRRYMVGCSSRYVSLSLVVYWTTYSSMRKKNTKYTNTVLP